MVAVSRIAKGTDQQEALWDSLVKDDNHVLVEARAGTGKSTACREGMHRVVSQKPHTRIRYAVFSKANADEFREACPERVSVGTVHSFGFEVLRMAYRSVFEKNKSYILMDRIREARCVPRTLRRTIAGLVSHAKNAAILPDDEKLPEKLSMLAEFFSVQMGGKSLMVLDVADKVLKAAADCTDLVDFDDMIWMPAVHQLTSPAVDQIYLDEVQDWNPAQHALLPLLCQRGRVIAVGDRWQSIYGFRGADMDSIPRLEGMLHARREGLRAFPLTITWRCPRSHVAMAQEYVSDIQARDKAPEGELSYIDEATADYLTGEMVLCPTNAPLIAAALRLIAQRRRAVVRGRAVGEQLTGIVRSLGEARTVLELTRKVEKWRTDNLERLADMDGVDDVIEEVKDKADGILAVLASCDSPAVVESRMAELFDDSKKPGESGPVVFSTIHRAKGLEADRVKLMECPARKPTQEWEHRQARNLRYVALTRSKQSLCFVEMEATKTAKKARQAKGEEGG